MQIRNDCSTLPQRTLKHIRRSLSCVYPPDLHGIAFIRLIDKTPSDMTLHLKRSKLPNRLRHALGYYMPAYNGKASYIALHVPKILYGVPRWCLGTTVPTLLFASTLAHEVGHHLIAVRGYALHPSETPRQRHGEYGEEMVDRYAFEVVRKMKTQMRYRLGHWLTGRVAGWHYALGKVEWERENYKLANARFLKAFTLNPEFDDARQAYWLTKDQAEKKLTGKSRDKLITD